MSFDLSKLSASQLNQYIHVQAEIDRQASQAYKVLALRDFYAGRHPLLLTERQREFISGARPRLQKGLTPTPKPPGMLDDDQFPFSHNLVRSIIDTLRERLAVTGVTVHNEAAQDGEDNPIALAIWEWWNDSRLDSRQIDIYRRALRDGVAFVIVGFDNEKQRPQFYIHRVDAGSVQPGIVVHRDPEDETRIMFASRYWVTAIDPLAPGKSGLERKTVYLPNEIRKYVRGGEISGPAWVPTQDDDDNGVWPIPWVDRMGKPLGVAVIAFENPGGSEVEQIIGLQNALNKTWLDIIAAADTSGFPVITIAYQSNGVPMAVAQDDADDEGKDELRLSPGRILEVDDATVSRMEAANLTPMLETMWTIVQAVSGVSRTPSYYLRPVGGGDVPSGEALKQLESGLVRRAEERQLLFGQAWQDVFKLAYRINNTYGAALPDMEPLSIDVSWQDANVRNELAEVQTAQGHQALGVPKEELWKRLGYTPEQIAEFKNGEMADAASKVSMVAAAMRVSQTASAQPSKTPPGQAQTNAGGNTDTTIAQQANDAVAQGAQA